MLFEIKNSEIYRKLIDYAFKKCDVFSISYDYDSLLKEEKKILKIIKEKENIDEIRNQKDLKKISKKYLNDNTIFNDRYCEVCESDYKDWKKYGFSDYSIQKVYKKQRISTIEGPIKTYIYNKELEKTLNIIEPYIKFTKKNEYTEGYPPGRYTLEYYLEVNDILKNFVLEKTNFNDWKYPFSLEDLTFYKNEKCFLYSVGHENLSFIYCDNKEEYNYLKSLGVTFKEEYKERDENIPPYEKF